MPLLSPRQQSHSTEEVQLYEIHSKRENSCEKREKIRLPTVKHFNFAVWLSENLPHLILHILFTNILARTTNGRSNTLRSKDRSSAGPRFAGIGLLRPNPSPRKLTWKYNSMLTYIPVSFLSGFVFFQKTLFWLRLKIGLGLGWVPGLGLGLRVRV